MIRRRRHPIQVNDLYDETLSELYRVSGWWGTPLATFECMDLAERVSYLLQLALPIAIGVPDVAACMAEGHHGHEWDEPIYLPHVDAYAYERGC